MLHQKGDRMRKSFLTYLNAFLFCYVIFNGVSFASGYLTLPLQGYSNVTCVFGNKCYDNHLGNDYATVTVGHEVVAAYEGTVIKAIDNNIANMGNCTDSYGNYIKINHGTINGKTYETRYAHLLTGTFLVKEGDKVYRGQPIAKSGNSGCSTGPHLHFEVRIDGVPVDPYNENNWLWTTKPPSHGFFNPTNFDFNNGEFLVDDFTLV